jgi:hypothetical protein
LSASLVMELLEQPDVWREWFLPTALGFSVDALQSNDSEFTVWDDTVSGFGERVRPTER